MITSRTPLAALFANDDLRAGAAETRPPQNHRQPRPQELTPHPGPKMDTRIKTKVSFRVAWSRHGPPQVAARSRSRRQLPLEASHLCSPLRGMHCTGLRHPPTRRSNRRRQPSVRLQSLDDIGASTAPKPSSTSPPTQLASPRARSGMSVIDTVLAAGGNVTTQTTHPTKSASTAGGGKPPSGKKGTTIDCALQLLTDTTTFRHKQL